MNREMRRKDREVLDRAEIDDILRSSIYGHLGLCDEGEPYVVPLIFGVVDGVMYFHCAHEGRKMDVVRKNPRACFQVDADVRLITADSSCGFGGGYRSVMAGGVISVVESEDEKIRALAAMMSKCAGEDFKPEFPSRNLAAITVLRLDPDWISAKARYS